MNAEWIESWSTCAPFTLTSQTSHALITTLRGISNMVDDLLSENYDYVMTERLQSDPIERHFSIDK